MGPTGLKSRCQQDCVSFWGLQGRTLFPTLPSSRSWPPSLARGSRPPSSKPVILCPRGPSSIVTPPSHWRSASKDSCDYIVLTQIIQHNLPLSRFMTLITSAKPLLPCKVTCSQVLGTRTWTSLQGSHYSAYQSW